MTRWLLAAEADKIQDFVFRSSRLVQVAGGSSLLSRFCAEVPPRLIEHHTGNRPQPGDEDIVISAGGSFRLTFAQPEAAIGVGRDLAEAYYRATDSTLTVAEPQSYEDDSFDTAVKRVELDLRTKKADRQGRVLALAQMPYVAFCASCGVGLASDYWSRHPDEQANYMCDMCRLKAAERDMGEHQPGRERFLSYFQRALKTAGLDDLPEKVKPEFFPADADEVGGHDARNYVAYIVADGNGMGVLFSSCKTVDQMRQLSDALTDAMWAALAQATSMVAPHLRKSKRDTRIPVTPLIVGGDDLFALAPAPYALDFARQVCLKFESELRKAAAKLGLVTDASTAPTMSAAVVICKSNYPYALAHRQGEALLGRTKELFRNAYLTTKPQSTEDESALNLSAVDCVIVKGGDLRTDQGPDWGRKQLLPSLAPYWVSAEPIPERALNYGVDLGQLLCARRRLRSLPGKRRAELRALFVGELPTEHESRELVLAALDAEWKPQLEALLRRIARNTQDRVNVEKALDALGYPDPTHARWRRLGGRQNSPYAHGLPDLFDMWDFAQDLKYSLDEYEEEGR